MHLISNHKLKTTLNNTVGSAQPVGRIWYIQELSQNITHKLKRSGENFEISRAVWESGCWPNLCEACIINFKK